MKELRAMEFVQAFAAGMEEERLRERPARHGGRRFVAENDVSLETIRLTCDERGRTRNGSRGSADASPYHALVIGLAFLCWMFSPAALGAKVPVSIDPLVRVLAESQDPQLQLDILRGLQDGLRGRRNVGAPARWEEVEARLGRSPDKHMRDLVRSLSLTFGSSAALTTLRETLKNPSADWAARTNALRALLQANDKSLPEMLHGLLVDPLIRGQAIRALASFDHAATPGKILSLYADLPLPEKRDALNTLVSRPGYGETLLAAVAGGTVPTRDLTADIVRQLRNFQDAKINAQVDKLWGTARETSDDKKAVIAKYRQLARAGGNAVHGRAVFARICQQCHTLFGEGGKVGPDITGSARADLEYILETVIDPNAVIPNEYRSSMVHTKDDRVITGIITRQDDNAVVVATANDVLTLSRTDIDRIEHSEFSMMPEGLVESLSDKEFGDLIAYLRSPAQVPAQ